MEWNPIVLSKEQAEALPETEKHFLDTEGDKVLWMQEPERFMNHSCVPNTKIVGRSDVALRMIPSGEEITSDYIDTPYENFRCNCGSGRCRYRE